MESVVFYGVTIYGNTTDFYAFCGLFRADAKAAEPLGRYGITLKGIKM